LIILLIGGLFLYALATEKQDPIDTDEPHMKAVVYTDYGSPDVLQIREIKKPAPNDDQVLVKVRAVSINPLDWHFIEGRPYIMRGMMGGMRKPKNPRLGVDYSGTVEAVGKNVTQFKPGDEVFGNKIGAFAEYLCPRADRAVAMKPANITFEQAAGIPVAGLAALQGLRDHGRVQPGQKVLINGAGGGVGTFAVQIAKDLGAEVHAVCSTRNVAQSLELGAVRVFDYGEEDFTRSGVRYDVLFDNAGSRSWAAMRRVLAPGGTTVLVGGPRRRRMLGPLGHIGRMIAASKLTRRRAVFFIAKPNRADLATLRD